MSTRDRRRRAVFIKTVKGAGGGAWSPLSLGAALTHWWSADDHGTARMTDDGAGLISAWADKVGGVTVTAATTARPTWTSTAVNSAYAGLTFNGTANTMAVAATSVTPVGATAGDMAVSGSQAALAADATVRLMVAYGAAAAATVRTLGRTVTTAVNRALITDSATVAASLNDTAIDFSGLVVLLGNWSGTTEGGRVNGNITNPATAVIVTLNTSTVRIRIGASTVAAATLFWNGTIRHVIITTALSVGDREKLEAWLAWDMGAQSILPVGHTYKSARP